MKTEKMSLANIQGKLSRTEMRNIMAGSGSERCPLSCGSKCADTAGCECKHAGTSNQFCASH